MKLALAAVLTLSILFPAATVAQDNAAGFRESARSVQKDLADSLKELAALRAKISEEKIPLNRKLRELETALSRARSDHEQVNRDLDSSTLDLSKVETEIHGRETEVDYLSGLLDEYARNFESSVHIAELQRYRGLVELARNAQDDETLSPADQFETQLKVVETSLDRLTDLIGGDRFRGKAIASDGAVQEVDFAILGPLALFRSVDGERAGVAELYLGSLEPNMVSFDSPEQNSAVSTLVASGIGTLPFDPTMGSARKIEAANDSFMDEVDKGGIVMIAILILAAASLLVASIKLFQFSKVRMPPQQRIASFLDAVKSGNLALARQKLAKLPGPTGEMLEAGLDHVEEPKQLVEEVMFEKVLETRLSLNRLLSFIAVSAAAAPLMGLLGTVTGIINTFKMITVFGTGDASTLSGGISEALITTKFGLIVAIPSLFLHAYLSRKSKRVLDRMEKTGMSFLNRIPSSDWPGSEGQVATGGGGNGNGKSRSREDKAAAAALAGGAIPVMAAPQGADH